VDFSRSGLSVVGGRIDKLPDGNPVTYTRYHCSHNDIPCMRCSASEAYAFRRPTDLIIDCPSSLQFSSVQIHQAHPTQGQNDGPFLLAIRDGAIRISSAWGVSLGLGETTEGGIVAPCASASTA
jgi:hypothetical protein